MSIVKMVHDYPNGIIVSLTSKNSTKCQRKSNPKYFTEYRYKMTLFVYFYKVFRVIFIFLLVACCYLDGFRGFWNQINLYFLIRHSFWNFLFAINVYTASSCAIVMFQFLNSMIFYLVMHYKQFNSRLTDFVQKSSSANGLSFAITA